MRLFNGMFNGELRWMLNVCLFIHMWRSRLQAGKCALQTLLLSWLYCKLFPLLHGPQNMLLQANWPTAFTTGSLFQFLKENITTKTYKRGWLVMICSHHGCSLNMFWVLCTQHDLPRFKLLIMNKMSLSVLLNIYPIKFCLQVQNNNQQETFHLSCFISIHKFCCTWWPRV